MTRQETVAYRAALAAILAEKEEWGFHVTAQLYSGASRKQVETAIRFWCQRVNRLFLGRNWAKQPGRWMEGVAIFESGPHNHAHMVLRPPLGAVVLGAPAAVFGLADGVLGKVETARGYIAPMQEMFADIPGYVWLGGIAGVAAVLYYVAKHGEDAGVHAFRVGARR